MHRIGLISDTHGLLRPEALAFLQGCEHIVHGGDIGDPRILEQLAALAPVTAVRGNNDRDAWSGAVPDTARVELQGLWLYVIHDLAELEIDPAAEGVRVVVCGHSHRPKAEERGGVWYVNPGSAGPPRFRLPISAAELNLDNGVVVPRIVELVKR
ncbi:metallophosphoesterase family protein [Variovorax sp. RA8]|uniref:metallophosphoesterase family protein n=1 Tax=Variovorax sp. (strain JCM 16519 / RA8) TaxID=662548 RepID=UPI0013184828|nr:metallophosphoesterase family protein [Variovorax sp. RA8]VTU14150.1 Phosphodiesterase YfcE [Variovorax sp. RA8]